MFKSAVSPRGISKERRQLKARNEGNADVSRIFSFRPFVCAHEAMPSEYRLCCSVCHPVCAPCVVHRLSGLCHHFSVAVLRLVASFTVSNSIIWCWVLQFNRKQQRSCSRLHLSDSLPGSAYTLNLAQLFCLLSVSLTNSDRILTFSPASAQLVHIMEMAGVLLSANTTLLQGVFPQCRGHWNSTLRLIKLSNPVDVR